MTLFLPAQSKTCTATSVPFCHLVKSRAVLLSWPKMPYAWTRPIIRFGSIGMSHPSYYCCFCTILGYTVVTLVSHFSRDILRHLGLDLHGELSYTEQIMIDNPKNYQVWHHRRVIVEWMNDASEELHLTEEILRMDAKNYHAWQHRQWAIKTFQ